MEKIHGKTFFRVCTLTSECETFGGEPELLAAVHRLIAAYVSSRQSV